MVNMTPSEVTSGADGPGTLSGCIGIDPTGKKFAEYYPSDIRLVPDFFSAEAYRSVQPKRSARIVTSIAMFYDLEAPIEFARQIESILAEDKEIEAYPLGIQAGNVQIVPVDALFEGEELFVAPAGAQ